MQKPVQGLSVTNGENPVDSPTIFSKIFYPDEVEKKKEKEEKKDDGWFSKGKEAMGKMKDMASGFTNVASGVKNLFG